MYQLMSLGCSDGDSSVKEIIYIYIRERAGASEMRKPNLLGGPIPQFCFYCHH